MKNNRRSLRLAKLSVRMTARALIEIGAVCVAN
jgi:hypothetical protein